MKRLFFMVLGMVLLTGCTIVNDVEPVYLEGLDLNLPYEDEEVEVEFTDQEKDAIVNSFLGSFDDIACEDDHDHSNFTGPMAVSIALEKYGVHDDITYMYDAEPVHYGGGIGYYVALKSKLLQEQGGDGIMITLFVSEDGQIYEF